MEKQENKKYWIWLSLLKNLSIKKKRRLLEKFKNPKELYNANKESLLKIDGIGEKYANHILDENIKKEVYKHIQYMEKYNIDIISIEDREYPEMLKNIYDPPLSLYIKGNKDILNKESISIVGCREASTYGKSATKYFSYNISKQNYNIISGMANGIDSYAHIGTICAKGTTIAVVGTGLDIVYPSNNIDLQNEILKNNGAVISEYPLGTKPEKMNFPERNRLISGMSKAIVVIEAKEKSGTLITVDFAIEQGREVFVVPGNINSTNSVGTNELIKQGAQIATNYMDIINSIKR